MKILRTILIACVAIALAYSADAQQKNTPDYNALLLRPRVNIRGGGQDKVQNEDVLRIENMDGNPVYRIQPDGTVVQSLTKIQQGLARSDLGLITIQAESFPGVDPTGETDSTAGLQAAIDYALPRGYTLVLPPVIRTDSTVTVTAKNFAGFCIRGTEAMTMWKFYGRNIPIMKFVRNTNSDVGIYDGYNEHGTYQATFSNIRIHFENTHSSTDTNGYAFDFVDNVSDSQGYHFIRINRFYQHGGTGFLRTSGTGTQVFWTSEVSETKILNYTGTAIKIDPATGGGVNLRLSMLILNSPESIGPHISLAGYSVLDIQNSEILHATTRPIYVTDSRVVNIHGLRLEQGSYTGSGGETDGLIYLGTTSAKIDGIHVQAYTITPAGYDVTTSCPIIRTSCGSGWEHLEQVGIENVTLETVTVAGYDNVSLLDSGPSAPAIGGLRVDRFSVRQVSTSSVAPIQVFGKRLASVSNPRLASSNWLGTMRQEVSNLTSAPSLDGTHYRGLFAHRAGDRIYCANPSSGIESYVCSTGGYSTTAWTARAYPDRSYCLASNGNLYFLLSAAASTVEPTGTVLYGSKTESDGVAWICVAKAATLAKWIAIPLPTGVNPALMPRHVVSVGPHVTNAKAYWTLTSAATIGTNDFTVILPVPAVAWNAAYATTPFVTLGSSLSNYTDGTIRIFGQNTHGLKVYLGNDTNYRVLESTVGDANALVGKNTIFILSRVGGVMSLWAGALPLSMTESSGGTSPAWSTSIPSSYLVVGAQYDGGPTYEGGMIGAPILINRGFAQSDVDQFMNNGGLSIQDALGGSMTPITSGSLIYGARYQIVSVTGGASFVPSGAASDTVGLTFTAGATAPTWGSGGSLIRVGAMLIGDVSAPTTIQDLSGNALTGTLVGAKIIVRRL